MTHRFRVVLSAFLLSIGAVSLPCLTQPAWPQERIPLQRVVLIRDAETEALLNGFATQLFRVAGLDPRRVRIMLVRDRAINAFVTSGNRMFINTGLLQQADTADEVAGPMAHETAHVAHGDISRLPEQAQNAMLQMLGGLLIAAGAGAASGDPGIAMGGMLGGMSMAERRFMSFSRSQEENADDSGLRYLDRLGWPANGLLALFTRLSQQEALVINRRDPFLITHPLTPERMEFVRTHIEAERGRALHLPAGTEARFQMVKAKLIGFLDAATTIDRLYPRQDLSAPARYARAVAAHRFGHSPEAIGILDGLIAEQPANPWLRELKAQILFESGKPIAALEPYREAVRLVPDQPLIRQSMAQAMIETGDKPLLRQAIEQLESAQRQDREDDTTWHFLGIAYGKLGDVAHANLALAEEAMLANDIPTARRFARQAAEGLPPGPARLRALDISNAVKKENRP